MTIVSFHYLTCWISTLYSLRYLCPDLVRMSTPLLPTRPWSWTLILMTYRSNTGRYRATSPLSSNPTSKQSRESNHYMHSMSDPHSEENVSWLKCLQLDFVLINLNIMILNCLWFVYASCVMWCRYLHGGAESGFRRVLPEKYTPRLFHFHGDKRGVMVKEVSPNIKARCHNTKPRNNA